MASLILLNMNNTVRRSLANPGGYINLPLDQEIIPGALNAISQIPDSTAIVGIHNAGGIWAYDKKAKRPFQTMEEAVKLERYTLKLLPIIKAVYICTSKDGSFCRRVTRTRILDYEASLANASFRLPDSGMLILALKFYSAKIENVLYVGDEDSDAVAAESIGMNFAEASDWWK